MKLILNTILVSAVCALPCLADPKADVQAAVDKLASAPNYSWTASTEIEGGQFTPVPIHGKASSDGFAVLTQERDGNLTTAVRKGDKVVISTDEGWQSSDELGRGGGGGGRGRRGGLLSARTPVAEAQAILKHVKELKAANDAVTGELTEAGAKELSSFARRDGQRVEPTRASGSVRFWLKEGQLSKMEVKMDTTSSFGGQERDFVRTTTYEIKDVGTTKVEVPEEGKKKLGA
jgi:hypothetical protein